MRAASAHGMRAPAKTSRSCNDQGFRSRRQRPYGLARVDAVNAAADTELALALDAGDDLTAITPENTDVVVEFTVPSVSLGNVLALVKQGVDVVVGTTGWTEEKLDQVRAALAAAPREGQSVFIAPNFAISAVLADHFAKVAAPYFESAEVIELHHPTKVDAPSGTAFHTAQGIAEARKAAGLGPVPDAPKPTAVPEARWWTASTCTPCVFAASTPTRRCCSATPANS